MRTRYARATALVAVVLASLCVESVVVAAGSCPKVPAHTLSSDCNGACESYQTCMAPASTTSASCRCFGKRKDQLVVLIPFGKTTAAQLAAASTTLFSNDDEAEAQSWASNDDLTKIAALSLSTLVTDVVIRGGSSSTVLPSREQRFVANVAFDKSFVSSLTQMTKLTVDNINLKASIAELAVNLPSNLLTLNLRNDRLIEFPTALTTLKALQRLDLELNYITDINPSHALSELTDLHLGSNQISTFTAVFPKLTYLDLGWNKLTVPPASLANHTRLETLFFDGNSISSFTQEYAVSSLKDLRFYNNTVMSEFDAILPNLDNLDLRYNSFTKFPLAVFNNTKLNTLELAYNKLSNVSFTNEQANFLNTLDGFSIDNSSLKSDCADSERFYFSNAKAGTHSIYI
uniref:Uncharacterized protein n=1 Tax=Globisporangium ultimum (strain ATCC 200006 / CBS 805.95 / DAOM BR144) TaxID=431595 RepID=K3WPU4_GLOUD